MSIHKFIVPVSILFILIIRPLPLCAGLNVHQSQLQPSNYVVIGAFAVQKNAMKFTSYAKKHSFDAHFEMNPGRNLYYVYVFRTNDHERALNEARRLRSETEFADAWVFDGQLGNAAGKDINPETREQIQEVKAEDAPVQVQETTPSTTSPATGQSQPEVTTTATPPATTYAEPEGEGKKFIFNLYRADDRTIVPGDVQVMDTDRSRKVGTYKGNELVRVSSPNSKTGGVAFVAEVFGFRKTQHISNYNNPVADDITQDDQGNIVVPFELVRLRKGDIAIMYNVYFYKDAAIMRPESQYEVNSLLQMMKENPKYRIRIHGHTNGNAPGKIISMGDSKSFFSLTGAKEGYGTATKLSEERANAILHYLVDQGIDTNRMQVKAWGGKRPLYDKLSNKAGENVRVEIEILEDK